MAGQFKKIKEPYLTQEDRKRIAAIEQNPIAESRKFKALLTLKHPKIDQEICIYCYGNNKEAIKKSAQEHIDNFIKVDKKWSVLSVEMLKTDDLED